MLFYKTGHQVAHQFLDEGLVLLCLRVCFRRDFFFKQLLGEVTFEIIAEDYQDHTNLLHVAEFVQRRVVLSTYESHIFLDKRNI